MKTLFSVIVAILSVIALICTLSLRRENKELVYENQQVVDSLNLEKQKLFVQIHSLKITNAELTGQKAYLQDSIGKLKKKEKDTVAYYEEIIKNAEKLTADTVYQILYTYFPVKEWEKKPYVFAESQIRGIYFTVLDHRRLQDQLSLNKGILSHCEDINAVNDSIINNQQDQIISLEKVGVVSTQQITLLTESLVVSEGDRTKQQKRKTIYKYSAIGFLVLLLVR